MVGEALGAGFGERHPLQVSTVTEIREGQVQRCCSFLEMAQTTLSAVSCMSQVFLCNASGWVVSLFSSKTIQGTILQHYLPVVKDEMSKVPELPSSCCSLPCGLVGLGDPAAWLKERCPHTMRLC